MGRFIYVLSYILIVRSFKSGNMLP